MAIEQTATDIVQELVEFRVDMQDFRDFLFEPADAIITRRLAPDTHSLQHYLDYLDAIKLVFTQESGDVTVGDRTIKTVQQAIADAVDIIVKSGGHVGYPTLAAATADKANITAKTIVEITNDTTDKNGIYLYDGTTFTKSQYNPVAVAKSYTDKAVDQAISIVLPNECKNGGFANYEDAWSPEYASALTYADGIVSFSADGSKLNAYLFQKFTAKKDNKYLVSARFKVDSALCKQVVAGSGTIFAEKYISIDNPRANEWVELSGVMTAGSGSSGRFLISHEYADAATAEGKSIEVDYLSVIDLTAAFGAEIPTANQLAKFKATADGSRQLNIIDTISSGIFGVGVPIAENISITLTSLTSKIDDSHKWGEYNSTLTVDADNLIVTNSPTTARSGGVHATPTISGHEYLFKARFKVDNADCQKIELGNNRMAGGFITINNPPVDEWIEVEQYQKALPDNYEIYILQTYADAATAAGKKLTVDYLSMIDVTDLLEGSEVNKDTLLALLPAKEAPYHISNKEVMNYVLSRPDIKTQVNNIAIPLAKGDKTPVGSTELYNGAALIGAVESLGQFTTESDRYRHTGYIDVHNFSKLTLAGFGEVNVRYAFYDEDYNPVYINRPDADDGSGVLNGDIVVPENAHYFVRTLRTTGAMENISAISIKGTYAHDHYQNFALAAESLNLSESDKHVVESAILWQDSFTVAGHYTTNGIDTTDSQARHTTLIDVTNYFAVDLSGFNNTLFERFWLDDNGNIVEIVSYTDAKESWTLNGVLIKPAGAKYFVANIVSSDADDTTATISGKRHLNSSDFQRKGEGTGEASGGVQGGFTIDGNKMSTYKELNLYNKAYPDMLPLKILHYGGYKNYDYGDRLNADCAIWREGWGMQMVMNLYKRDPTMTQTKQLQKNLIKQTGLLMEWGMEGFSWHVVPPNMDWGNKPWMMLKLGGTNVRSASKSQTGRTSIIQEMAPSWSERRDYNTHYSWVPNSNNPSLDEKIPTRVMLRQTSNFNSPEFYRMGYSSTQNATWDRISRARGTIEAPEALQSGDSIHEYVFSAATGGLTNGEPNLDDVAKIDVVYSDDPASDEAAKIVFMVKNRTTDEWIEKLVL